MCRSQFPLIPASAVTIHKSQGLSLDNTIVDLSDRVFGAGMAYVALSRVRSLSGLHLANFDPKCVIVSRRCLEEIIFWSIPYSYINFAISLFVSKTAKLHSKNCKYHSFS